MQFAFAPELIPIDIKEWNPIEGEEVYVREPTAGEYAIYEGLQARLHWGGLDDAARRKVYAEIVVKFARNKAVQLMFTQEMITNIAQGSSKPARRIAIKIAELGKLDDEELKELEKNLPATATEG